MNIIITMAGNGKRFRDAGYKEQKYKIIAHGKTLFDWSLLSLSALTSLPENKTFFIVKKSDRAKSFIVRHARALGIQNYQIIEIKKMTDGQATTALLADPYLEPADPILIYNIDTFIEPNLISQDIFAGDGLIPCFSAPGDHWSFVELGPDNYATRVTEKERISNHCSVGLYYFKSFKLFKDAYSATQRSCNERYIAPLYNTLIQKNLKIGINSFPADKVHVLGTPSELEAFISAPAPALP